MRLNLDAFIFATALLWAGVSLGGNLIAAPAKFTVDALEMPVALQVGRAQFTWIGYAEFALATVASVAAYATTSTTPKLILLAVLAFAIQRAASMPELSARTDLIVAGQIVADGNAHILFICLELFKFATLLVLGIWPTIADAGIKPALEA